MQLFFSKITEILKKVKIIALSEQTWKVRIHQFFYLVNG